MSSPAPKRALLQALAGAAILVAGELLVLAGNEWVARYFTPLMWTGYILLADALVASASGGPSFFARPGELALAAGISIVSWEVFEGVNLLLGNWSYVNLPQGRAARWLGYAWSYATITPAILVTARLIRIGIGARLERRRPLALGPAAETAFFWAGFLLFVALLLFPSPWLAPLPWISVLLWFEGMNDRLGIGSFGRMLRAGDYSLFVSLLVSGAVCGLLWESWNAQALAKWHYHVPYLPGVKLFEMPVLGFLGFPPFALECFLMYRFFRCLVPRRLDRDVLGIPWDAHATGGRP